MTENAPERAGTLAAPDIRRRRFSLIWILPIVAVLIAAWLGYTTLAEEGPTIKMTFKTAAGLEAGKTRIRHHDVELGVVKRIEPTPDLSQVVVTARMNKLAAPHLNDGTKFWVVRPRLSLTSLSGLETLVSGSFIEMDPGAGAEAREFKGLEEPPVVRSDISGTTYILNANKIGSIGSGSPVFFRGVEVGEVISSIFDGIDKGFTVRVFVQKPYDAYVHEGSQFWDASGISLDTGAGGFKIEVELLQAVLSGGIAFDTSEAARRNEVAKADATFALYADREAAVDASYTKRARLLVEFDESIRGLAIGAPVDLRGIKVGRVVDFHMVIDAQQRTVRIPIVCEIDLDRVGIINLPPEQLGKGKFMAQLVALGLRAQLRTSSLITGELIVAFDFFPDAPPAEIVETETYPKIPSVPTELKGLTHSVSEILDKVAALPLNDVVRDAGKTLDAAQQFLHDADTRTAPLLTSLRQTSDSAGTALTSVGSAYGRNSQIRGDLVDVLRQLQDTLKSVKALATYLDQHPESLVRGKGASQ